MMDQRNDPMQILFSEPMSLLGSLRGARVTCAGVSLKSPPQHEWQLYHCNPYATCKQLYHPSPLTILYCLYKLRKRPHEFWNPSSAVSVEFLTQRKLLCNRLYITENFYITHLSGQTGANNPWGHWSNNNYSGTRLHHILKKRRSTAIEEDSATVLQNYSIL